MKSAINPIQFSFLLFKFSFLRIKKLTKKTSARSAEIAAASPFPASPGQVLRRNIVLQWSNKVSYCNYEYSNRNEYIIVILNAFQLPIWKYLEIIDNWDVSHSNIPIMPYNWEYTREEIVMGRYSIEV